MHLVNLLRRKRGRRKKSKHWEWAANSLQAAQLEQHWWRQRCSPRSVLMAQVILWHLKGDSEVLSWIGRKSSNTLRNLCRKYVLWGFTLQMCWKAVTRSLNLRQGKRKGTATWPNKRRANYVMKFPTKILPPPCNFWIKPHSSPCKTSHCSLWEEPLTHISLGKLYSEGTAQIPKHCWKKSSFQTKLITM